jgi:hypothetical protein
VCNEGSAEHTGTETEGSAAHHAHASAAALLRTLLVTTTIAALLGVASVALLRTAVVAALLLLRVVALLLGRAIIVALLGLAAIAATILLLLLLLLGVSATRVTAASVGAAATSRVLVLAAAKQLAEEALGLVAAAAAAASDITRSRRELVRVRGVALRWGGRGVQVRRCGAAAACASILLLLESARQGLVFALAMRRAAVTSRGVICVERVGLCIRGRGAATRCVPRRRACWRVVVGIDGRSCRLIPL